MTHPTREHEERLRRALRAAADSVEPAADGLGRIRARLTPPRPLVAAWMVSGTEPAALRLRFALTSLRLRIGLALGPALRHLQPALRHLQPAFRHVRPAFSKIGPALGSLGSARDKLRTRPTWLRLAASMAAFLVIIGSGALAISKLQQSITPTGSLTGVARGQGHPGATGTGGLSGSGHPLKVPGWPALPPLPRGELPPAIFPSKASPTPTPTCTPTPTPTGTPTPTTSPTVSPSPGASSVPTGGGVSEALGAAVPLSGSGSATGASPGTNKKAC